MPHFKALMTTIYPVPDITAAKAWYAAAFGVEPYFDEPFYVGFDVAGYELGLVPVEPPVHECGNRGAIAYWGSADAEAAFAHFVAQGATALDALKEVGGGIKIGAVTDPYGNAIGIIENPNFKK